MKPTITITWNADEQAHVKTNKSFDEAYEMLQLDMLQDSLGDLEVMYKKKLNETFGRRRVPHNSNVTSIHKKWFDKILGNKNDSNA